MEGLSKESRKMIKPKLIQNTFNVKYVESCGRYNRQHTLKGVGECEVCRISAF
jgi:hypothetical protein